MVLEHITTDGKTRHEVDLEEKKHVIEDLEDHSLVTKKWGTQQKFVEKLISKQIERVEEKIMSQKMTISDCYKYNSLTGIESTQKKLEENIEILDYLKSYDY